MDIVFVHGMGRTPLSMLSLSRRLQQHGHATHLFGYATTIETLRGVSDRLSRRIANTVGERPYVLVGHSLGTVIIRNTLGKLSTNPPRHCFFLAPPMVACKAAKFFSGFWPYRIFTGEMGTLLAEDSFMQRLPLPDNLTIYAGTAGPRVSLSPFAEEPNDGILSVSETIATIKGQVIRVPSLHTFIMNSSDVFHDIVNQLEKLA